MAEGLEAIDSHLRVSTSTDVVLRAVDKEFSLYANFPKDRVELFCDWIDHNHPGSLLLYVEQASGSRQYLSVEGAGAIWWNRSYYCEFLDWRLWNPGDYLFQENLFIVLLSIEIIALARVYSIVHLLVYFPSRWLA